MNYTYRSFLLPLLLSPHIPHIPPSSAHSGSLLRGHIGKPLALIMLYSRPVLPILSFNHNPSPSCMYVCVCVWPPLAQQTLMNHFRRNASGTPQSSLPPSLHPPPPAFYGGVNGTGATFYCGSIRAPAALHVLESRQPNGIESVALQIKRDEKSMDSLFI